MRNTDDRMHWFALTFRNAGQEAGFLKDRTPKLVNNWRNGSVLTILGVVAQVIYYRKWDLYPDQHNSEQHNRTTQLSNMISMSLLGLCIGNVLFCFSADRFQFQPLVVEWVVVLANCVAMVGFALSTPHFSGRILGDDPSTYLDPSEFSDTYILLGLDTFITALHILFPTCFRRMLLVQLVGFLSYVLPTALLGSPHPETVMNWVVIYGMLICLSGMGLHSLEREQRIAFLSLIEEKSLRFQSDFQLAAFSGNDSQCQSPEDLHSGVRVTSEASSKVFGTDGLMSETILAHGLRERWLIRENEVTLLDGVVLGDGGYGVVLGARFYGADVAVKMPKQGLNGDEAKSILEACCNELRVLRHVRHPNIVSLYGALLQTRDMKLALVLELVTGRTLKDFMKHVQESKDLSIVYSGAPRVQVLEQIAAAMSYLHSREPPVVHGDLKSTNIFVEQRGDHGIQVHVKLLDFGLSRLVKRRARPMGGTMCWAAPELFSQCGVLPASPTAADMFSFGCVMFYVSTGRLPFQRASSQRGRSVRSAFLEWPAEEENDCRFLAEWLQDLVEQCTQLIPERRPGVDAVLCILADIGRQFSSQLAACEKLSSSTLSGFSELPLSYERSTSRYSTSSSSSAMNPRRQGPLATIPDGDDLVPEAIGRPC